MRSAEAAERKRLRERERRRKRRQEMTNRGLCYYCGKEKPAPGLMGCRECLDFINKKQQLAYPARRERIMQYVREVASPRYYARKAAGLCVNCGAPTDGVHVQCARHLERERLYSKRKRERMKARKFEL